MSNNGLKFVQRAVLPSFNRENLAESFGEEHVMGAWLTPSIIGVAVAVQHDPVSKAKYKALAHMWTHHGCTLRSVGDLLLAVACAMLQNGQFFDPSRILDTDKNTHTLALNQKIWSRTLKWSCTKSVQANLISIQKTATNPLM